MSDLEGDLIASINQAIHQARYAQQDQPEILLLMHYQIEYQFYRDLHEPAYDVAGQRRPYMGATIVVSRDVESWRVVAVRDTE
jgi:hypothetical protein